MISSYDTVKLQSLLKDFYQLTGIRVGIFNDNLQELVSYPPEIAPFCKLLRQSPDCAAKCHSCDQRAYIFCLSYHERSCFFPVH